MNSNPSSKIFSPFGDAASIYQALLASGSRRGVRVIAALAKVLDRIPRRALDLFLAAECRFYVVRKRERFCEASPALRRLGVDVDAWPMPPAGLFVVAERTVYLRSLSAMTIAHEFGHALDCALGEGVYASNVSATIREAFAKAREFVTPYAASGTDEFFAECFRAYVGLNDPLSPWPTVSREALVRCAPTMVAFFDATLG